MTGNRPGYKLLHDPGSQIDWAFRPEKYFKSSDGALYGYDKGVDPDFLLSPEGLAVDFVRIRKNHIIELHYHERGGENFSSVGENPVIFLLGDNDEDLDRIILKPGQKLRVNAPLLHGVINPSSWDVYLMREADKFKDDYVSVELKKLKDSGLLVPHDPNE